MTELTLLRLVEEAARDVVRGLQTVETEHEQRLVDILEERLIEVTRFRAEDVQP